MIKSNLGVNGGSMIAERKPQPAERVVENSVFSSFVPGAEEAFSLYTGCSDIMPTREVSTIVAYHCDMVARLITTFLVVLAPLTVLTTLRKNHIWDPDVQLQVLVYHICGRASRQLPIVDAETKHILSKHAAVRLQ